MTDWPLVSIVTPVLNEARYIAETVESVLGQDYPNVEYLIVDGGSTDGTPGILARYPVRVISLPGSSQSQAINEGWLRSSGSILAYLPGDDWYVPGALSRTVERLSAASSAGMVYGDVYIVDAENRLMETQRPGDFDLRRLLLYNYIAQPTTFVRRSVIDRVGHLDETLTHHLDYDLWLRIGAEYEVKYIPQVLGAFRIHPASVGSSTRGGFGDDVLKIMTKLMSSDGLAARVPDFRVRLNCAAHYYRAIAALHNLEPDVCRTELLAIARLSPGMLLHGHILLIWLKSFMPRQAYFMQWKLRELRFGRSRVVRFCTLKQEHRLGQVLAAAEASGGR